MPKLVQRGFTLIELLVVISIIAVLSTVGYINYQQTIKKSRDTQRQTNLKIIQAAVEQYHADNFFYPPPFTVSGQFTNTTGGMSPAPSPLKVYLNSLPVDPQPPTLYTYTPKGVGCTSGMPSLCTGYCLYTTLETTVPANDLGGACAASGSSNFAVTSP